MAVTSIAEKWVEQAAEVTRPSRVVWCDGSKSEYDGLVEGMLRDGTLLPMNSRTYPNCYLHRSHPLDVARTEQLTFICTPEREDVGPTNNWMAPAEAKATAGSHPARGHAGSDDVRHPLSHGSRGVRPRPHGHHGHRQRLRHGEHAHHDPRRVGGLRAHAPRRRLRGRAALARRSLARPPADPALPRGQADLERGLGLRGQRAARQEVPRAAHRVLAGAPGGMARRAHADHRRRGSRGSGDVPGRGHAQRVGQDQPGHGRLEAARAGAPGPWATTSRGCGWTRAVSSAR